MTVDRRPSRTVGLDRFLLLEPVESGQVNRFHTAAKGTLKRIFSTK